MTVWVLADDRPAIGWDNAVTVTPADETPVDFDSWFDQPLPCARSNVRCPQPGSWRGVLSCGHKGVLCRTHKKQC